MTEYEKTLELLEDLQTYLDSTETPSEALDNLYTEIVKAKKDINHEYVLYICQSKWRESND